MNSLYAHRLRKLFDYSRLLKASFSANFSTNPYLATAFPGKTAVTVKNAENPFVCPLSSTSSFLIDTLLFQFAFIFFYSVCLLWRVSTRKPNTSVFSAIFFTGKIRVETTTWIRNSVIKFTRDLFVKCAFDLCCESMVILFSKYTGSFEIIFVIQRTCDTNKFRKIYHKYKYRFYIFDIALRNSIKIFKSEPSTSEIESTRSKIVNDIATSLYVENGFTFLWREMEECLRGEPFWYKTGNGVSYYFEKSDSVSYNEY